MSFEQQLAKWAKKTGDDMTAIVRQSIQDMGDIAQQPAAQGGPMPVDTSFLRNSFATELNGAQVAEGPGAHVLGVARMKLGDYMRLGWTASYSRRRNYEPVNGGMFRDVASAQWQNLVAKNAKLRRAQ